MAGLMKFAGIALKNLFSKPATKKYPVEQRTYTERTRGSIVNDIDQCIYCGSCQRKCPSGAIAVDRAARTWTIDRMGCVMCENCVNNCPKNCLHTDNQYSSPSSEKTIVTLHTDAPQAPPKPKFTPEQIEEMKKAAAAKKAAKTE